MRLVSKINVYVHSVTENFPFEILLPVAHTAAVEWGGIENLHLCSLTLSSLSEWGDKKPAEFPHCFSCWSGS